MEIDLSQNLIDHPHAKTSWLAMRVDRNRELKTTLIVETDLVMNNEDPQYDQNALTGHMGVVLDYLNKNNQLMPPT